MKPIGYIDHRLSARSGGIHQVRDRVVSRVFNRVCYRVQERVFGQVFSPVYHRVHVRIWARLEYPEGNYPLSP